MPISTRYALALLACCLPAPTPARAAEPIALRLDGRAMLVNGQAEVPLGLFGTHAVWLTPELIADLGITCNRHLHTQPGPHSHAVSASGTLHAVNGRLPVMIDCMGDRYQPPTVLVNKDFEPFFERIGREYAERCKKAGWKGYVEFWNEPYLNWAERSRIAYNPKYYDVTQARDDGPVTIKGWDRPVTHLRWRRLWGAYRQDRTLKDGTVTNEQRIAWTVPVPPGLTPGDTFRGKESLYWRHFAETNLTVVEEWGLVDPTAVGWWSGRQNLEYYLWMFLPWARAIKAVHPDQQIIGGWDFNLHVQNWAVWKELYEPLIDAAHPWMDGYSEHHYGVETRYIPLWYEVGTAYAQIKHGRWMRGFNTECGGELDPAVYGAAAPDAAVADTATAERRKQVAQLTYTLRDIIELASRCPDKVGSRTANQIRTDAQSGAAQALRFLRTLRGPLLNWHCDAPDLWPVAALHAQSLVLVVFNNANGPRELALEIAAPAGARFAAPAILTRIETDPGATNCLALLDSRVPVPAPTNFTGTFAVPARHALRLTIPLDRAPATLAAVERRQFFARQGVLQELRPGARLTLNTDIAPALRGRATRAWLRLALEGPGVGAVQTAVNDAPVAGAGAWLRDLPLDPAVLRDDNAMTFDLPADTGPATVVTASLVLELAPAR